MSKTPSMEEKNSKKGWLDVRERPPRYHKKEAIIHVLDAVGPYAGNLMTWEAGEIPSSCMDSS